MKIIVQTIISILAFAAIVAVFFNSGEDHNPDVSPIEMKG